GVLPRRPLDCARVDTSGDGTPSHREGVTCGLIAGQSSVKTGGPDGVKMGARRGPSLYPQGGAGEGRNGRSRMTGLVEPTTADDQSERGEEHDSTEPA